MSLSLYRDAVNNAASVLYYSNDDILMIDGVTTIESLRMGQGFGVTNCENERTQELHTDAVRTLSITEKL